VNRPSQALPSWIPRRPRRRRAPLAIGTRGPGSLYRKLKSLHLLATRDRRAALSFLFARYPLELPLSERLLLLGRLLETTNAIRCYHTQVEMLAVIDEIFRLAGRPGLTVVEAGAAKGASTAKLSLATARAGGRMLVCDSFRGIPPHDEQLCRLDGTAVQFRKGAFAGRLPTVQRNVARYGAPEVCEFFKGWFEETLPGFERPVDVVLLDVDLLSSTRTCLVHLFPRVRQGGVVFTQDGHIRAIVELLASERFWREEVGVPPPHIEGLGTRKMLAIRPR